MRFFLDTEFSESGPHKPIELISIGIVGEHGRSLYAVSSEFNPDECNDWVKANVLPNLGNGPRLTLNEIAGDIKAMIDDEHPIFYGYFADYDWVVFCQIFGKMIDLPNGWPMLCYDLKQIAMSLGNPKLPEQKSTEHNALNDARWNKEVYDFLIDCSKDVVPRIP